ncbi:MAG: ribokinase [Clostridiaceae bacterium]|nr:ribokinase [Clostridiaceae bacterium]
MITVIGSINMDLVVTAKRAPDMGETVMGTSWAQIPGGKGANQAVAAARSGGETWMVGRLGQDSFGNTLLESLMRNPVNIDHVEMQQDAPTGIAAIIVDGSGRNRITVISGANFTIHAEDIEHLRPLIARSSVLLMQLEIPLDAVERALIIAKEENTFSILNPAPATELPDHFYQLANLMTPNESELAVLSGCPTETESEWTAACRVLLDRGLSAVLVTLGDKGSFYMDRNIERSFPAYHVTAVDTTAAGDSFNGTLACEIDRYLKSSGVKSIGLHDEKDSCKHAEKSIATHVGAGVPIDLEENAAIHAGKSASTRDVEDDATHVEDDATHVEDVATNVEDVATNVEDVATHVEDVATHAERITASYSEKCTALNDTPDVFPKLHIPHDILDRAVDRATRAAAITVTREGAQPSLPTVSEIDNFDAWYEKHKTHRR